MALVVTHTTVADGDPLIDGDDWNANHTLTGGGTFQIPQLIESKTGISAQSSVTFSSLNGDSDEVYLIRYGVTLSNQDTAFCLQPNNSSTGLKSATIQMYTSGAVGGTYDTTIWLGTSYATNTALIQGDVLLNAKSGTYRGGFCKSNTIGSGGSHPVQNNTNFQWSDTSTNITSLVFLPNAGTVSGWIKLYKMVDLTI